jgi:hypothetical protein
MLIVAFVAAKRQCSLQYAKESDFRAGVQSPLLQRASENDGARR